MKSSGPRNGLLVVSLILACSACGGVEVSVDELPPGWAGTGDRWWREGADTSGAFRQLEDFESMGIAVLPPMVAAARDRTGAAETRQGQIVAAVRRSLLPLYRNEPEIVDSLFERIVAPQLGAASEDDNPDALVERNKKRAYGLMRRHFREPSPALSLGSDVPVPYPDSLRRQDIGGAVRIQVRIDASGAPVAMLLTEGIHPTLDFIALQATTQMRWHPAYLLVRKDWQPVPSWARFAIHFASRP